MIRPDQAADVLRAILTVYRDFGNREDRSLARLKHLLADLGVGEVQGRSGSGAWDTPCPSRIRTTFGTSTTTSAGTSRATAAGSTGCTSKAGGSPTSPTSG